MTQGSQRHVLICWELGGGLGHLTPIAAVARRFLERGWRVSLVLADLSQAHPFLGHLPVATFQAPVWLPRLRTEQEPVCFSDILQHRGYRSATGLASLAAAWRSLLDSLRPDLLIGEYAPTALLAARGLAVPKILLSTGFGELQPGRPDLCLRPWLARGEALTATSEGLVVSCVNRVLEERGLPPIGFVADLYAADHIFLFTLPELDLVKDRLAATYLRPPDEGGRLTPATWPKGAGPKLLAYLKPASPLCLPALQAIADLPCRGLVLAPGLPAKAATGRRRPGLCIATRPGAIGAALASSDVVVCHGGKVTVTQALLAGKPLLLIPEQLEQFHTALRVEELGAGLRVRRGWDAARIREALSRLLTEPRYGAAATALARKHAALTRVDAAAAIVGHGERLLELSEGARFWPGKK